MPAAKGSARTPLGPIIVPSPYTDMIKGQNFQGYISKFILNSVSIKFWQSIKFFADSVRASTPFPCLKETLPAFCPVTDLTGSIYLLFFNFTPITLEQIDIIRNYLS